MKVVLLFAFAAAALAQDLPDAPGKAVVERMCKACHGLETIVSAKYTKDRWGEIVDDMVSRGAQGKSRTSTAWLSTWEGSNSSPSPRAASQVCTNNSSQPMAANPDASANPSGCQPRWPGSTPSTTCPNTELNDVIVRTSSAGSVAGSGSSPIAPRANISASSVTADATTVAP